MASSKVTEVLAVTAAKLADLMETAEEWTRPYNQIGQYVSHNPVSGVVYSGVNRMFLGAATAAFGYERGAYSTYQQWQNAECQVRKGEKGVKIVRGFRTKCCPDAPADDREECYCGGPRRTGMALHTVFNAGQVEGEPPVDARFDSPVPEWDYQSIQEVFSHLGANWKEGAGIPWYIPDEDLIVTPPPAAFDTPGMYAGTVAHEYVHWSGHPSRCGRWETGQPGCDGVEEYLDDRRGEEEIIAELGAQVVVNSLGLEHEPLINSAAYLKAWAKQLRGENGPRLLTRFSGQAHKAAAYIVEGIENAKTLKQTREQPIEVRPTGPEQLTITPPEAADVPAAAQSVPETPPEKQPITREEAAEIWAEIMENPDVPVEETDTLESDSYVPEYVPPPPEETRVKVGKWLVGQFDDPRAVPFYSEFLQIPPARLTGPAPPPTSADIQAVKKWWTDMTFAEPNITPGEVEEALNEINHMLTPGGIQIDKADHGWHITPAPRRDDVTLESLDVV